jgi:hypothetical protein
VGADQDLLFGKIAVARQYCTQEQLDKCLILQANSRDRVPLGQLLRTEGYISDDQHSQILELQRKQLSAPDPVNKVTKESILLGKLAVRMSYLTEEELNDCLRLQAQPGEKRTIGEILVAKGFLKAEQVKALLSRQQKKIMSCEYCSLSFTVLTTSRNKFIACPKCKGVLKEGKPSDSVRTDVHLETSTANQIRKAAEKKPKPAEKSSLSASVKMVRMKCPMCGKEFCEPVDSKGRVDCPHCLSSFSA